MVASKLSPSSRILIYSILALTAILWTVPTLGLLITSIRIPDDVAASGWWTVFAGKANFTLQNYVAVLGTDGVDSSNAAASNNLGQAFLNTIIMAVPSTVIPIFLAALAAYGFAWMSFPGRKILFMVLVALLVIPLQMSLIPILRDYRTLGVKPEIEMGWKHYVVALILFNVIGIAVIYALQRWQVWLPLNPQNLPSVSVDSSLNTAISFVSNTNWQGYSGEVTMSYFTQMLGLTVQNFLSAATGIAVVIALIRGFARHTSKNHR